MRKRLAMIMISAALAVSMTACGEDSRTANAAGRLTAEAIEAADLPELTAEDQELEEPETAIKGELTADNTDKGSGDEAAANTGTDKPTVSNTSSTSSAGASGNKTTGASGNATANDTASTTGNSSSTGNTGNTSGSPAGTAAGGSTGNADARTGNTTNDTTTPSAPATPTVQEHTHSWVHHSASGHYEEQIVKAAWDEPVYEDKIVCGCGKVFNTVLECADHQCDDDCYYSYSSQSFKTETIHHEAETTQVWVEDQAAHWQCDSCGAYPDYRTARQLDLQALNSL